MKIRFTNVTPFTKRWQHRNELAETLHAEVETSEGGRDFVKEQYEAMEHQSLILAAQRMRMV